MPKIESDEFGKNEWKPTGIKKALNRVCSWIYNKDENTVVPLDRIEGIGEKKSKEIEESSTEAKLDTTSNETSRESFNYLAASMEKEERILKQARSIATKQMLAAVKSSGKEAAMLKRREINSNARIIIKNPAFKQTVKDLDAASHYVNEDIFYTHFMEIMLLFNNAKTKPSETRDGEQVTLKNAQVDQSYIGLHA